MQPFLVSFQEARGAPFMTIENVLAVLDAREPPEVVQSWLEGPTSRRRRLGLSARACA
jgi:hypothetical protein